MLVVPIQIFGDNRKEYFCCPAVFHHSIYLLYHLVVSYQVVNFFTVPGLVTKKQHCHICTKVISLALQVISVTTSDGVIL